MTALQNPMMASEWTRVITGGVPLDLVNRDRALAVISRYAEGNAAESLALVSANLDHIYHFGHDQTWLQRSPASLRHEPPADGSHELHWMTLIDGVPLARTAHRVTGVPWPRLSGSDLIDPVLDLAAGRKWRVGFLGGTPETHRALDGVMRKQRPQLDVSGYWAPDREELFDGPSARRLASEIAAADTTILVVGLGKPRQEQWIEQFGELTNARVLLAFGAVVDFLAGRIRRAPRWVSDHGLEWAWRLSREPRRLARRYLVQGPPAYLKLRRDSRGLPPAGRMADAESVDFRAVGPLKPDRFSSLDERAVVTAVVVTYNSQDDVGPLISSLRAEASFVPIRVIACDNGSTDRTVELLRQHPDINVLDTGRNAGYSAGINAAVRFDTGSEAVLILNPDVRLAAGSVVAMLDRLRTAGTGAVVPMMVDESGRIYTSIRREPALTGALGDSLFGGRLVGRPRRLSEIELRTSDYHRAKSIDWATGAAILLDSEVIRIVGEWDEQFFLYSEETDYFRRIRDAGFLVYFDPKAIVSHRGAGSGSSAELTVLMTVNKARYAEKHMSRSRAAVFRLVLILGEVLRGTDPVHRRALRALVDRSTSEQLSASLRRIIHRAEPGVCYGTVVIPAHNEQATIRRTLEPLSPSAVAGNLQVLVVCNGCTDNTPAIARSIPGVAVIEIAEASKVAALNVGDGLATSWPRLYLDADIECSPDAALAVLDALRTGPHLAARPTARYDTNDASLLVRAYYRARQRVGVGQGALWGAGVYAVSGPGHERFDRFPDLTGDDLFIDDQFANPEKIVVPTSAVIVRVPRKAKDLLAILRRTSTGNSTYFSSALSRNGHVADSTRATARKLLRSVRGPRSAVDAAIYAAFAASSRVAGPGHGANRDRRWLRDESSRQPAGPP